MMNISRNILTANFLVYLLIFLSLVSKAWSLPEGKEYLPPKTGGSGGGGGYGDDGPNEPANYAFSYEVKDPSINLDFGHNEKRKGDLATGLYKVLLPDGRTQIVEYEAGVDGYKPQVKYEGVASFGNGGGRGRGNGGDGGYNYNAASNQKIVRQPAPKALISTPKSVVNTSTNK